MQIVTQGFDTISCTISKLERSLNHHFQKNNELCHAQLVCGVVSAFYGINLQTEGNIVVLVTKFKLEVKISMESTRRPTELAFFLEQRLSK